MHKPWDDPEATRLWDGLSVYDTQAQARRTARRYRGLGAFLVAVDMPLDGRCRIERTLHRTGHHTIWGDADLLHAAVARVVSVAADEGSECDDRLVRDHGSGHREHGRGLRH